MAINKSVVNSCILFSEASGLILPMKNPDGTLDGSSVINHITLIEQNLEAKTDKLASDLAALKTELAAKTRDIAFQAILTVSMYTGKGIPLRFDTAHYNAGNGYSTSTGVFKAPVAGTYFFSAQIYLTRNATAQTTAFNIVQNRQVISFGVGKTSKDLDGVVVPVTAVTYVKEGDEILIVSDENVTILGHSMAPTLFVGALLTAH